MKLEKLIEEKNWLDLVSDFKPEDIANALSFFSGIQLSYDLLFNKEWDESIQEYAVRLLEEIQTTHSQEWNNTWEYEAFLGLAYDIILQYDKRYIALQKAFEKTSNPPPQLLIALANCCHCPGDRPITYDQAVDYLKIALKDYLYVDGVGSIRSIYWLKCDIKNEEYWANILMKIEDTHYDSSSLSPSFIKENLK